VFETLFSGGIQLRRVGQGRISLAGHVVDRSGSRRPEHRQPASRRREHISVFLPCARPIGFFYVRRADHRKSTGTEDAATLIMSAGVAARFDPVEAQRRRAAAGMANAARGSAAALQPATVKVKTD
jgi:uncharacterized membrane protein